jgi:hypothetical protein
MLAFKVRCYELDRQGNRIIDEALLSRCKGRAKSEVAGDIVCGEFVGPVRFGHWAKLGEETWWGYRFEKGEPVGRPVRDPFIRCLATEESQSGNTYDNVTVKLEHLSKMWGQHFPAIDLGRGTSGSTRVFLEGGGEIRPSTASSAAKDGGKETNTVADEPHLYLLPELRDMYDTVLRNMTKRPAAEPWMLATSTMFQPGRDSTCERIHKRAKRGDDPRLLVDHVEGVMPKDWDDDDELLASLRKAAGSGAEWMDFTRRLRECRREGAEGGIKKAARYFINCPQVDTENAIDPRRWEELAVRTGAPAAGTSVAAGFDGSDSGDSTALVGCEMETGRRFVVGIWECPLVDGRPIKGWKIPRDQVKAAFEDMMKTYVVSRVYLDPKGWREEIADWRATYGKEMVVDFPTNQWTRFAPAVDSTLTGINTGSLTHDGSEDMAKHWANARKVEVNPRRPGSGWVILKESPNSPLKIDAAIACCLAGRARDDALSTGWTPPSPVSQEPLVAWR